jgi:hypothetical protein
MIDLATVKKNCDYLRWDMHRIGCLSFDDPLWTLLEEKERQLDAAILAEINRMSRPVLPAKKRAAKKTAKKTRSRGTR